MKTKNRGFTLIEILVVIAIIGILVGLLFPAIKGAILKAKIARAKTELDSVSMSIRAYVTEYGKLPLPDSAQGDPDANNFPDGGWCDASASKEVIRVLTANDDAPYLLNPRRIVFLGLPNSRTDGTLTDPWGKQYLMKFDANYDGNVEYYTAPGFYKSLCVVVCLGKNGTIENPATGDDLIDFQ